MGVECMSTKTHDEMIKRAVDWARSLGYGIVESNLGTKTGADAIFQNQFSERVILEVVTGSGFKGLFNKPRIKEIFGTSRYWIEPETLGLIIVGDRVDQVKNHGLEAGLPEEIFDPPYQRIFPVLARDFKEVIPVLLVSLLGSRASLHAREYHEMASHP